MSLTTPLSLKSTNRRVKPLTFLLVIFYVFPFSLLTAQDSPTTPSDSLTSLGTTLLNQVDVDLSLAENEHKVLTAIEYFKAAENWEQYVQGYNWLSSVYNYYQEYESYTQTVQLAMQKAEEFLPHDKGDTHSNTLNNMAALYHQNGNYRLAIKYYRQSLHLIPPEKAYKESLAMSYHNIGKCFQDQGDFDDALRYFPKALELYQQFSDRTSQGNIPGCLFDWAKALKDKNQLDSALVYFEKSIKAGDQMKKGRDYVDQVKLLCYQNMADLFLQKKQIPKALNYIDQALALQKGKSFEDAHLSYRMLSKIHAHNKDWNQQFALLNQCNKMVVQQYKNFEKHQEIAKSFLDIGKFYQQQEKLDSALSFFQKALVSNTLDFNPNDLTAKPPLENLLDLNTALEIIRQKGKSFYELALSHQEKEKKENLELALATYHYATQIIQQIRQTYSAEGSKLHLSGKVKPIFEEAILVAQLLYQSQKDKSYLADAFYFSESSKAILLLESIQQNQALNHGDIPDSLLLKEQTCNAQINFLKNQLSQAQQTEQDNLAEQKEWKNRLFELQEEHKKLIARFEKNYPRYYQLKFNTQLTSVADLQEKILNSNSALIEYFHGSEHNYVFCITPQDIVLHQWPSSTQLSLSINDLRNSIIEPPASTDFLQAYLDFTIRANQLYEELLQDVLAQLPSSTQQLIFIPDEYTNYLPFELLLQQKAPANADFSPDHLSYLLNDFRISYNYSATLFKTDAQKKPQDNPNKFIGFAPTFESNIKTASRSCSDFSLSPLLCNQTEVEAIQSLWGGVVKKDAQASKSAFMEEAPNYQIVHLATHACIDKNYADLSKIHFKENAINGFDLHNLRLKADLVVLSACNTGSGKMAKGEGVLSLARNFTQAGCPSSLMSLWSVDDCSTSDLMIAFYQQLYKGMDKDEALQQAKINFLKNTSDKIKSHPYYWAGFVQTGNISALKNKRFRDGLLPWMIGLLLPVFVFWFFSRKKHSKTEER